MGDGGVAAADSADGSVSTSTTAAIATAAGATGATGAQGGTATALASAGGEKAPIVIGYVGQFSGFAGIATGAQRDGWVVWSKMINAKGGINGHPVRLLVGDDGGSDSNAVSIARDFVENKGAIALSISTSTATGIAAYALSKHVPVIGVAGGQDEWYTNPLMFFTTAYLRGSSYSSARILQNAGAKRVAVAYCVEAPLCKEENDLFVQFAKEIGLTVVAQQSMSVTAPDYTAECINMRSAGADSVFYVGETNGAQRMVSSCTRQSFKPLWGIPLATGAMASNPELEGSVSFNSAFAWFAAPTIPAMKEFHDAFQRYLPSKLGDGGAGGQTISWIAAKAFEKAAAHVGDKPTAQDIINGLNSFRGETLGGLMPGKAALTFVEGQPHPQGMCGWAIQVRNHKWVDLSGFNPVCP